MSTGSEKYTITSVVPTGAFADKLGIDFSVNGCALAIGTTIIDSKKTITSNFFIYTIWSCYQFKQSYFYSMHVPIYVKIIMSRFLQLSMKILLFILMGILFTGAISPSFAHTTVNVEQLQIEVGWNLEPPVEGIRNNLVLKFTERGDAEGQYTSVINVFKNLDAKIFYGGASKSLDIESDPKPGYYFSKIIPTKTGTYEVELKGEIKGIPIDVKIPVEDVEPTSVLDFPPKSSQGDADVSALKNAISSLQQDITKLKSGETTVQSEDSSSYDFAIFGISIAGAAIILAVISLVKRK